MNKKTATFIKFVYHGPKAIQALYKLSEPLQPYSKEESDTNYVVVSALPGALDTNRCETFIFKANEKGDITDWTEMKGSTNSTMSHKVALKNAGYKLMGDDPLNYV